MIYKKNKVAGQLRIIAEKTSRGHLSAVEHGEIEQFPAKARKRYPIVFSVAGTMNRNNEKYGIMVKPTEDSEYKLLAYKYTNRPEAMIAANALCHFLEGRETVIVEIQYKLDEPVKQLPRNWEDDPEAAYMTNNYTG